MEENNNEIIEFIPGTNIPRPRDRKPNITEETDEQYVAYLKEYYNQYFPNVETTKTLVSTQEKSTLENEISEEELKTMKDNLEQYADSITNDMEQEKKENQFIIFDTTSDSKESSSSISETKDLFSFDVISDNENNIQELNTSSNVEKPFSFDISSDEQEVVVFTPSNENLNNKIRNSNFYHKVVGFFNKAKEKAINLSQKLAESFEDINFSFEDEPTSNLGRSR